MVYLGTPPINVLSKHKRAIRPAMHKPHNMPFKRFTAGLMEIKKNLPLLPGEYISKKMHPEELNEILPHAVPNGWSKKYYLQ